MTRILQVVDDALEAAAKHRHRNAAEVASVKEAEALPAGEIAQGLRRLASELRDDRDTVSYADLGGLR